MSAGGLWYLLCPQAQGRYEISWYTIDGGGGTSSGGPYKLTGTIGQPDAGGYGTSRGVCSHAGGKYGTGIFAKGGSRGRSGQYPRNHDCPNVPDSLTTSSPLAQIDAVAELCHEVGEAAGMDYGCTSSDAWLGFKPGADMTDAYIDHFRYNENTEFETRWHYTSTEAWFKIIKDNINANQPLQYGLLDFSWGGLQAIPWYVTGGRWSGACGWST